MEGRRGLGFICTSTCSATSSKNSTLLTQFNGLNKFPKETIKAIVIKMDLHLLTIHLPNSLLSNRKKDKQRLSYKFLVIKS